MRKFIRAIGLWLKGKGHVSAALRLSLIVIVCVLILPMIYIALTENIYEFRDKDPNRGAAIPTQDKFGDQIGSIKYLPQNWRAQDSLWFYTITQGSDLLPYDLFMEVEQDGKSVDQIGSAAYFRDNNNINFYGYLPQHATARNPDGLPVGFVKDMYLGKPYMGFSCAACHTGQVNYNGVGIRIDGGPATSDLDGFVNALAVALQKTRDDPAKRARFVKRVRAHGNYASDKQVGDALEATTQQLRIYNTINFSHTQYGYGRLDAFGRIYNRVLEHVLTREQLQRQLQGIVSDAAIRSVLGDPSDRSPLNGNQREYIYKMLSSEQLEQLRARITNEPNAPVSYPFLWDIPQHDYVQWNGLAANAGLGSVGRNVGEVIGVFGTLNWKEKQWFSVSSLIAGQGLKTHVSFESSVNVHNLRRIEERLRELRSPRWVDAPLPPINAALADKGKDLFSQRCIGCHSRIDRTDDRRRVLAQMSSIDCVSSDPKRREKAKLAGVICVGTDPRMAENSVRYGGWSGILRNQYVSLDAGSMLLDEYAPAVALLTKATLATVATPYPHSNPVQRSVAWAYDLLYALFTNDIKPSMKGGSYIPDTTVEPLASFLSYKARPLNGIWATAPYLHNGSVPTLYDLLLPAKCSASVDNKCRPEKFWVGSREFDPKKVGLAARQNIGTEFDTGKEGNLNSGHEYTNDFTDDQRRQLVEYLKQL